MIKPEFNGLCQVPSMVAFAKWCLYSHNYLIPFLWLPFSNPHCLLFSKSPGVSVTHFAPWSHAILIISSASVSAPWDQGLCRISPRAAWDPGRCSLNAIWGVIDRAAPTFPRGGGDVWWEALIALEANDSLICHCVCEVNISYCIVSGGIAKSLYHSTFEETPHINLIQLLQVLNSLWMQIKPAVE